MSTSPEEVAEHAAAVAPAFRRALLKLSGESLMGDREYGVDPKTVSAIAREVLAVQAAGTEVAVVVGGVHADGLDVPQERHPLLQPALHPPDPRRRRQEELEQRRVLAGLQLAEPLVGLPGRQAHELHRVVPPDLVLPLLVQQDHLVGGEPPDPLLREPVLDEPTPRFDVLLEEEPVGTTVKCVEFDTANLGAWDSSLLTFLQQAGNYCESRGLEFNERGLPDRIARQWKDPWADYWKTNQALPKKPID